MNVAPRLVKQMPSGAFAATHFNAFPVEQAEQLAAACNRLRRDDRLLRTVLETGRRALLMAAAGLEKFLQHRHS